VQYCYQLLPSATACGIF